MADAALFIGWGSPVRGREQKAIEVFNESMAYWGQLQSSGEIEGVEAYLLTPHGGDLGGFAILKGEQSKLMDVERSEGFQRMVARANLIIENLGVVHAFTGEGLANQMAMFNAQVSELA